MNWNDILKILLVIILWLIGLYLREAVYKFMRKKEINLINRVMKKIYLVGAILLIAGVCSCEKK